MSLIFVHCDSHPDRRAGWRCQRCSKALCPACTGERRVGSQMMDVCALCQGAAEPLRERRAVLHPFATTLPEALLWPVQHFASLALWSVCEFGSGLIGLGSLVRGALFAYLFHLTRWSALGHDDSPGAQEFRSISEDIGQPALRVFLATIWVTGPALLLRWAGEEPASPLFIGVVSLLGLTIAPISLLASAVETPYVQIVNPLVLGGYAVVLGTDYLLMLVFGAMALLVESLLDGFRELLPGNIFARLCLRVLSIGVAFAFFRALGLLLRARGDDLRYGSPRDYLEPVLGAARPQAGELESVLDPGTVEARAAATAPIELEAAAALDQIPVELAQRLRAGDLAGALSILEANADGLPALTLSAEAWLKLGQAGAEQKRVPPALVALKRAIEVAPEGPLAPAAWLLAARLYDEGLRNRAQSDKLLSELARRFPLTKEGEFAARRLKASTR